jgi:hypothetical protein
MAPEKFFYKITKDLIVALIVTYFLILIPELVLPGIVSSHFNPKYLLAIILILGLVFSWLGKKYPPQEKLKFQAVSRNILNAILFIILVLLLLGLYKMHIWQIIVVAILALALIIAAEKMLVSEDNK